MASNRPEFFPNFLFQRPDTARPEIKSSQPGPCSTLISSESDAKISLMLFSDARTFSSSSIYCTPNPLLNKAVLFVLIFYIFRRTVFY